MIQPVEALIVIVPTTARLEVEAQLLNKDVGVVQAGQRAAVKLDALPYTVYGSIDGTVTSISADAVLGGGVTAAGAAAAQGPVYVAGVALARTSGSVAGN